jgi:uncharacterized membrane protein
MFVSLRLADLLGSLVHMYAFSIAIARLAANDPVGAIRITTVAIFCVVIFAVVIIGTEVASIELRRRLHKREEVEQQKQRTLEDKDA